MKFIKASKIPGDSPEAVAEHAYRRGASQALAYVEQFATALQVTDFATMTKLLMLMQDGAAHFRRHARKAHPRYRDDLLAYVKKRWRRRNVRPHYPWGFGG